MPGKTVRGRCRKPDLLPIKNASISEAFCIEALNDKISDDERGYVRGDRAHDDRGQSQQPELR